MSEITLLFTIPVIFTKDKEFPKMQHSIKPGSIFILPEDAVLYVPPITSEAGHAE